MFSNLLDKNLQNFEQTRRFLEEHTPFHTWLDHADLSPYYLNQSPEKQELLLRALTHSSFTHENATWDKGNNERLEFLGDALLDAEISYLLFRKFPDLKEGDLSKIRSSIVNEEVLSEWASFLGIGPFLFLGKGELQKETVEKAILADAFEALIGAVGLIDESAPKNLIKRWIEIYEEKKGEKGIELLSLERLNLFDPKTRLQELTLEKFKELPEYHCSEKGEGFEVSVYVRGKELSTAYGKSKKKAEIAAAKEIIIKKLVEEIN